MVINNFEYNTGSEFIKLLKKNKLPIIDFILLREKKYFGTTAQKIFDKLSDYIKTMQESIRLGLKKKKKLVCLNNESFKLFNAKINIMSALEFEILYSSLAASEHNCSMGKIIACPTAGSCGILPGAIIPVSKKFKIPEKKIIESLIIAGEIGRLIANRTTISGAAGGCMVECGVGSAMTSAALTFLFDGSIIQIFNAAALALKNNLGLTCDPVAGLVEAPCVKRNSFKALESLAAAQMSLAGIESVIPFDEIVDVVVEVSMAMPEKFKETSTGGLAATPTGKKKWKEMRDRK